MKGSNPNWTPESKSERGIKSAITRRDSNEGTKVLGTPPVRPRRVKVRVVGELLDRGWKAVEIMPPVILYVEDVEKIHQAITNLLEDLAKKHQV